MVLPPPRVLKKNLQVVNNSSRNNEGADTAEERKFMEILNQTANQVGPAGTPALSSIPMNQENHMRGPGITMDDSLELSPPSTLKKDIGSASAKKLQVHVPPLKTTGIAPQKILDGAAKLKYQDEDNDFNKLLNSSPKKNPKYTNSV